MKPILSMDAIAGHKTIPNVLTIAGSDSSGGAGIQADLKTFAALKTYGLSAITAITAQNTREISAIEMVSPHTVRKQLDALCRDIRIDAIKIGMIGHERETVQHVIDILDARPDIPVVWDPVAIASTGTPLIDDTTFNLLRRKLLPRVTLATPNLDEAAKLFSFLPEYEASSLAAMCLRIVETAPCSVLLTGGHLKGPACIDTLIHRGQVIRFDNAKRISSNTHGTGCTLSSAIAAHLAHGWSIREAVSYAIHYVRDTIIEDTSVNHSDETTMHLTVGNGCGPLSHFQAWWSDTVNRN